MFSTIISLIETTLQKVDKLAKIYDYNTSNLEGFPCAVYLPVAFNNDYLTNQENIKGYSFKIYVYVETKIAGKDVALKDILVPVVDDIIKQFDTDWNFGTIEGHRVWTKMTNGNWGIVGIAQGEALFAELNLTINLISNN
jgi:hypothetical protein